jgi:multiple sugar transport system permease protein
MTRRDSRLPAALVWIAPAVLLLLGLSIFPLFYFLYISFRNDSGWTLAHYARLFTDRFFAGALWHTLVYAGLALILELLLGLALAMLIDSLRHGRGFFRVAFLIPMLLPPVVAAVIWRLIYNPQFGLLNGTLRMAGFDPSGLTWIASEKTALLSLVIVDVWEWTPFFLLLLSAGLQAIPHEPVEAARIDGASWWQIQSDIILPQLKPVIFLAVLLRAMDLLRIFDQVFLLTQGGPGFATETVSLYIYRTAFRFSNFGYAAAMSVVLLMLATLLMRLLMRVMRIR